MTENDDATSDPVEAIAADIADLSFTATVDLAASLRKILPNYIDTDLELADALSKWANEFLKGCSPRRCADGYVGIGS